MRKKQMCALGCGHPVGKGDRHSKYGCPPKAGSRAGRRARARLRGFAQVASAPSDVPVRGVVIAGTGKPRGDGQKGGKKAKAAAPTQAIA